MLKNVNMDDVPAEWIKLFLKDRFYGENPDEVDEWFRALCTQYWEDNKPDYKKLFKNWMEVRDYDTPDRVLELVKRHDLSAFDRCSFKGFCLGYVTAFNQIKDET